MENWLKVPWNEKYEVSDRGRIRSSFNGTPRLLKPSRNRNGYTIIELQNSGSREAYYVHRLVAMVHIGHIPDKMVVHHKNDQRDDNRKSNLEIITRSENRRKASRTTVLGVSKAEAAKILYNESWAIEKIAEVLNVAKKRVEKTVKAV
jgi:hypothetical protein